MVCKDVDCRIFDRHLRYHKSVRIGHGVVTITLIHVRHHTSNHTNTHTATGRSQRSRASPYRFPHRRALKASACLVCAPNPFLPKSLQDLPSSSIPACDTPPRIEMPSQAAQTATGLMSIAQRQPIDHIVIPSEMQMRRKVQAARCKMSRSCG